ncbi:MAG TPA: lactonase family protein [Actinomycetales bacterium]|nr:lactonase family protein [Actinomycetales bacterium]
MSAHQLLIGTYTASSAPTGRGEGIYSLTVDPQARSFGEPQLVARIDSASWLLHHGAAGVLWAAREEADGSVAAFKILDDATLEPLSTSDVPTGAGSPCHLELSPQGDRLIISSYGDGAVTDLALTKEGEAARNDAGEVRFAVHNHEGSGPNKDRQGSPHAHSAIVAPDGEHVIVADLGTDELRRFDFGPDGALSELGIVAKLPGGAGPRHMAVSQDGFVYVAGELDNYVHILRWEDDASATYLGSVPAGDPETVGGAGDAFPAHIEISEDGTRLWVSNRGPDIIATFAIEDGGMTLRHLADTPVGGENPRHFAHVGECLVVGHQNSDSLALLPLDENGVPQEAAARVALGSPVCVVPVASNR